jgi:protein TonB
VVNIDGSIDDVKLEKGIGFGCDEEAIRVVKSMPRWNPAKLSGRAVRSTFKQSITFVLSE